ILAVTSVDPTKTILSVTRGQGGTSAAAHGLAAQVSLPGASTLYANGTGSTFLSGSTPLPPTTPAGTTLYALTMRVSAYGAASQKLSTPGGQQLQVHDGLGFDPAHPSYLGTMLAPTPPRHIDGLENQVAFNIATGLAPATLFKDLFGQLASPPVGASQTFVLNGGSDGGPPVAEDYDAALALFEGLEDIAIVAAPGSSIFQTSSEAIIDSLITHVSRQRAYRVAILDTPQNQMASDNEDVRAHIDSSYAALYVPWVIVSNPLARSGTAIPAEVAVPPSGFMAGIYARNDDQNSVAKAPANEVVLDALDFERQITFGEQATLNPLGINCLRYFPDRGNRVWGARTASSDSEFMYINVRRMMIYLEHSIDNSTQWAVFENNGPDLWARVKDAVDSFLYNEFVEGRLLGTSPAQAYFVRCDRTTMTQNDLDNGRMICLIGVALLKPAEFVIFRIGQKTSDARS
ncbi:MAG: phage tail sheath subtilisin-like domain-containing protein, partial [Candidatus Tumulicola sp.]